MTEGGGIMSETIPGYDACMGGAFRPLYIETVPCECPELPHT